MFRPDGFELDFHRRDEDFELYSVYWTDGTHVYVQPERENLHERHFGA